MRRASPSIRRPASGHFGMRDAWAYARAVPRLAGPRHPKLSYTALARVSAMRVRELPEIRRFVASDGAEIAYRTYAGPADRQLVLIHGSACFGDQLHRLAAHLARGGHATVHTLDMRGHGQSPPSGCDPARFARDVGEFAAALRAAEGSAAVIVGGHSAGGGLAVNVARGPHADAVSGWLLLAPYLRIDSDTLRPFFGGWLTRVYRLRLSAIIAANLLGITRFNDRGVAAFDREACLHDPRFAREWSFAAAFGFGPGPIPDQAHRRIAAGRPVLLLSGERDECFVAERFPAALAPIAPHGEVRLFAGLGHWDILVDREVLNACADWLDSHFGAWPAEPAVDTRRAARFA
jgi:pimeloyl-ACP methyl ester carboxylesterase